MTTDPDDKVTMFSEVLSAPDPDVVEKLEEALRRARNGDLRSVVIVGDHANRMTYTAHAIDDFAAAVAALDLAKHKLLVSWREKGEDR